MPHNESRRFTARYLFPGDAPPIENGTLEVTGGIISAVHNHRDATARNLGNVAILPGLINSHTHLEFSDLKEPIPPGRVFADWIRGIVAHRRDRIDGLKTIVRGGLRESVQSGTTTLGEIATDDDVRAHDTPNGPRCVVFRELLGFQPEQIEPQLAVARRFLDSTENDHNGVIRALSPHSPYSVHPELFTQLVTLAKQRTVPLAVHLAETREELELLDRGTGPLVEMLRGFGVWREDAISRDTKPLDYLQDLADAPRVLIIHGNYLDEDELRFLAGRSNFSLVFCPRTHAFFGHDPHPWQSVLETGGNIAVGTDSRASNPDLSLWRELCFLRRSYADLSDAELLRLGTTNGAAALGLERRTGSLTAGKSADLTIVRLNRELKRTPLFHSKNSVVATMLHGEWLAALPDIAER